jgi:hypothetical protein
LLEPLCGVALMLLAMGLQPALSPRRIAARAKMTTK